MLSYIRLLKGKISFTHNQYSTICMNYSYAKTAAQVLLRWSLQQGYSVIPKSLNPEHIKQNKELDFKVEESDILQISKLFQ